MSKISPTSRFDCIYAQVFDKDEQKYLSNVNYRHCSGFQVSTNCGDYVRLAFTWQKLIELGESGKKLVKVGRTRQKLAKLGRTW